MIVNQIHLSANITYLSEFGIAYLTGRCFQPNFSLIWNTDMFVNCCDYSPRNPVSHAQKISGIPLPNCCSATANPSHHHIRKVPITTKVTGTYLLRIFYASFTRQNQIKGGISRPAKFLNTGVTCW